MEWTPDCTSEGVHRHLISIIVITASAFALSPNPDISRAEALYQRTEYGAAITALKTTDRKDAAGHALLGKAYFMQGQYKEAVANLEKAAAQDGLNADYQDWIGKAYGRLAESSSFVSALGYAKKTVHAFERAVELAPSNLEALCDLFEYYLEAPGIVGGGLDKAEDIARRITPLDEAESHWARARLAEKRKDLVAAEREFRAAVTAAPDQVGRTLDLAAFLSSHGRYAESDALFRSADEKHPNSPKVLFARAAAYIRSKRKLDEAQTLLQAYLSSRITPEDATRAEAAALLKTARELGQNPRLAARAPAH